MTWTDATLPSTGSNVAVESIASRLYQGVKPVWGDSGENFYVSPTTPLPVAAVANGYISDATTGVDANSTSSVTDSLDVSKARRVGVQVVGVTGTHSTHVIQLQGSVDDTNWAALSVEVTGEGIAEADSALPYIRAKVKTAEGGTATANVTIFAK